MIKLILYCEGVMEATWLTALVCVPLFFSVLGERIQNEKNYLVRSLAMVLLTAWIIKFVSQWALRACTPEASRFSVRSLFRTPLVMPILLNVVTLAIATIFSVSPWDSFWGLAGRREGSFTSLSALLFCAAIVANIRSQRQVDRIVTTAILTAVPISLYGIGQRFSVDPTLFYGTAGFELRAGSTFSNASLLGAYLIMVTPLSFVRLLRHYLASRTDGVERTTHLVQAAAYALITFLELLAITFTVSRGSIVALLAGSFVLFLILGIYWSKRWLIFGVMGIAVLLLAALVLLSRPIGPLRGLANRKDVKRFTSLLNAPSSDSSSGRTAIWKLGAQAAHFSTILEGPDGRPDRLSRLRSLIGYGPELVALPCRALRTMEYNTAMEDQPFFDRIHNDFWDTLLTTGILGLAANLALTFLFLYWACKWLGLVASPSQQRIFWSLLSGGSVMASLGLVSWQGTSFLGLGPTLGAALGLMAYLLWISWRNAFDPALQGLSMDRRLIMMGLLAAMLAHSIEISFSFTIETTLLYSAAYLALLVVIGHRLPLMEAGPSPAEAAAGYLQAAPKAAPEKAKSRPAPKTSPFPKFARTVWLSWRPEMAGGMIIALVLANFGEMLILTHWKGADSALQTLLESFTQLPGSNTFTWSLPLSIAATWLLASVTLAYEAGGRLAKPWRRSLAMLLVVSSVLALVYWLLLAKHTTLMLASSIANLETVGRLLRDYVWTVDFHHACLFLLILGMAVFLSEVQPAATAIPQTRLAPLACGAAVLLAIGGVLLIYGSTIRWSKAGVMMNRAEYFRRRTQWPMVAAICEAAIKTVPTADNQYVLWSEALGEQAAVTRNRDEQQALFLKAEQVLESGRKLRPLASHFSSRRGDLYLKMALAEPAAEKRRALGMQAVESYKQASSLDPGNFEIWNRMAYVGLMLFKPPDEAQPWLLRSLELFPNWHQTHTLLGDLFFRKGTAAQNGDDRKAFLTRAATNYLKAIDLTSTNYSDTRYRYSMALGKTFVELRDLSQAIDTYKKVLLASPRGERWSNEEMLARLFADRKDKSNAVFHVQRAINRAPVEKRAGLTTLKNDILARPP
jgi:tetratricopeptide (TPR) repeat protein